MIAFLLKPTNLAFICGLAAGACLGFICCSLMVIASEK
jgi:UDP-N-acetylmuramyl pentapeptide phosphotransferase/UDP-N-acetylglucosamine-1-phosphate transferase